MPGGPADLHRKELLASGSPRALPTTPRLLRTRRKAAAATTHNMTRPLTTPAAMAALLSPPDECATGEADWVGAVTVVTAALLTVPRGICPVEVGSSAGDEDEDEDGVGEADGDGGGDEDEDEDGDEDW